MKGTCPANGNNKSKSGLHWKRITRKFARAGRKRAEHGHLDWKQPEEKTKCFTQTVWQMQKSPPWRDSLSQLLCKWDTATEQIKRKACAAIPRRVQPGLVEVRTQNILRQEKSQFSSCLSSLLGVWKDGTLHDCYRGFCGSVSYLTFRDLSQRPCDHHRQAISWLAAGSPNIFFNNPKQCSSSSQKDFQIAEKVKRWIFKHSASILKRPHHLNFDNNAGI